MSERRVKIARKIVATIIVLWSLDKLLYQGLLQIDPYKFGPKLEVHNLSMLINLHLIQGMYAGQELWENQQHVGCVKDGRPINWREIQSVECEITLGSRFAERQCRALGKLHIPCAGLVIPKHWFEDPEIRKGIQRALDNQCEVLDEIRRRPLPSHQSESEKESVELQYAGMARRYGCNSWFKIDRGRIQRLAILTLEHPWQEYETFDQELKELEEAYERGVRAIIFERGPHMLTRKTNRGRE